MKNKTKTRVKSLILNSIIIFLLIIMLYPLAMSLWSSVKNEVSFQATKWYPTLPMYFSNIAYAFRKLTRYMLNTVLVAGCGTLGMLFISSLAAYAFSKLHFPGKNIFYMAVISLMMIPGILTLVPSFMLYKSLIGLDNYMILILPQIVGPVFGVFLLRSFFEGIPEDIFEASRIDGAGEFKIYMKVCLPLSLPIMGTLAIMQITNAWNDYMWPMITIKNNDLMTISAGLMLNYVGRTNSNYPIITAGYLVASIPLIFIFIFANKFFIQGLTGSAMKL